jgi:hypothetical protein
MLSLKSEPETEAAAVGNITTVDLNRGVMSNEAITDIIKANMEIVIKIFLCFQA